jgi:hypothetical protein
MQLQDWRTKNCARHGAHTLSSLLTPHNAQLDGNNAAAHARTDCDQ